MENHYCYEKVAYSVWHLQQSLLSSKQSTGSPSEPSKHHLEVPDTEQFEVPEKEFNLREVKRDSDASSTSSEESIEVSSPYKAIPPIPRPPPHIFTPSQGGTQVESKSVRTHPERTTPLEQTNLSGDERSPSSARSSPSQGGVTGMVGQSCVSGASRDGAECHCASQCLALGNEP